MRDRNRERTRTKHSYTKSFGQLHPEVLAARDSLLARYKLNKVNSSRGAGLNRVVWRLSHHRPGIAPNDYTAEMAIEDRKWVMTETAPGYRDICVLGQRALFDELIALGHRSAALGNPFAAIHYTLITPPDGMPAELVRQRDELVAYYSQQADVRAETEGVDGYTPEYGENVIRYFDLFLRSVDEHNARPDRTTPACALALPELFKRYDLAAEYLRMGARFDSRTGTVTEPTRRQRKNALLAVRRIAQWRKWIDCPDYPERLNDYLKGAKGKVKLGGADAQKIEALDREEIATVRRLLDRRLAGAERAATKARTAGGKASARRRMIRITRMAALVEVALCGIRVQGIASLDGRFFERNQRGSIINSHVRAKSHDKAYWRWYWISPRAYRALAAYYAATDRTVPLAPGVVPAQMTPVLLIKTGQSFADTKVTANTTFVPVFLNEDGQPMAKSTIQSVLRHLLHTAGCKVTRPHVMRHCAADIAINDWGMTPSHVSEVFGWESVAMVLDRYSKAGIETVLEMFDAQSESDILSPHQAYQIASGTIDALGRFLLEHHAKVNERTLPMIWQMIIESLDQLTVGDPGALRPSKAMALTVREFARVSEWVSERSDRHITLDQIVGRSVPQGLPAPRITLADQLAAPTPLHPDADDGMAAA